MLAHLYKRGNSRKEEARLPLLRYPSAVPVAQVFMEAFVLTLVFVSLLIIVGMVTSVRLYKRRLLETGHFRQVRRSRSVRPLPDGTTVEETLVETIDAEAPIEQA